MFTICLGCKFQMVALSLVQVEGPTLRSYYTELRTNRSKQSHKGAGHQ
jgi:hypothetical protein